jgi:hypothetical protein
MNVATLLTRKLGIYLFAVLVAYGLAVVTASQHVVSSLASMGVEVGLADRLAMTLADLAGMAGMFLPLIAFGFLVAFLVAALLRRWLDRWQTVLYLLAGAAALTALHLLLHLVFGLTPVAIARSAGGILVQALAGAAGGWVYIALNRRFFPLSPFETIE